MLGAVPVIKIFLQILALGYIVGGDLAGTKLFRRLVTVKCSDLGSKWFSRKTNSAVDICATIIEPLKTSGQHLASFMLLVIKLMGCLQLLTLAGQHCELLYFFTHVPEYYCPLNAEGDPIRLSDSVQRWFVDTYSMMFTLWPCRWIVSATISIARFTGGWGVTAPSSLRIPKAR